ncbi:MAG: RNA polymerase sigma factor [Candidatus Poribacteria bacterium]|nr:RNA polymerase sigma factor [Candidatus Poribacteria bacterium]
MHDCSDATLIRRHLNGDTTALMRLWLRYDGFVYGIAQSVTRSSHAAEDIRQDVFVLVIDALEGLRSPDKFAHWLRTVTYNACKSWLRRRNREPTVETEDDPAEYLQSLDQPPDETLAREEQRSIVRRAIDHLPLAFREVIVLFYYEEYSVGKISELLEVSESTVKWRLFKGRETLRRRADLME